MTFLTILIALILQRFFHFGPWFSQSWFNAYASWFKFTNKISDWLGLIIIVLPMFIILAGINYLLGHFWLGFIKVVFAIIILLSYLDYHKPQAQETAAAIFMSAFDHIFGVLFWYMIFGMYGLALYIPITMLELSNTNSKAQHVKDWFDWIPIRLVSLTYALVGHFAPEFDLLHKNWLGGFAKTENLKLNMGVAAAASEDMHTAISIVNRTLITWLIVIAAFSLFVWLA